jgi:hypothetical protein
MAYCRNCEKTHFIWKKDEITGKFRLAYPSGIFHLCAMSADKVQRYMAQKQQKAFICKHGIKLNRHCRDCYEERKSI